MSLAQKAASGFFWTTLATLGARAVTIVGTFVLTRYLAPDVQGEVNVAFVFLLTVSAATTLGVPQYIATHPKADRDILFHTSVLLLATGLLASVACVIAADPVARWLKTPHMALYVPGLAVASFIERASSLPRNLLVRDMKFRTIGARVALGETLFAGTTIGLAHYGFGGHAIVGGNLVRATAGLLFLASRVDFREYLTPCKLRLQVFKDLWSYGAAISLSFLFHIGSVNWDNLFVSYRFGESATGLYNQAYRIAELPALSVGEQVNDVLVPSLARVQDNESRKKGVLRAVGLMTLVVAPMSAGIGAVSPTLVAALYPASYQGVAPYLAVLAVISMFRSIGSLATGYLQVVERTKIFIFIDFVFVVVLLGLMAALSRFGPVASVFGVVLAFAVNTAQMVRALAPDGISIRDVLSAAVRPLAACAPMIAAVLGLAHLLGAYLPPAALVLAQIAAGALVYVLCAFAAARPIVDDFLDLARSIARKKRSA